MAGIAAAVVVATVAVTTATSANGAEGGPVVRWVPEALPLDRPEAPVAGQPDGTVQLLPNASGVYEARPPFLVGRPR